jgi:hypothetical protein
MKVFVNGKPIDLLPGMKVRHAPVSSGLLRIISIGERVYDKWGNKLGQDDALTEGMRIYVR